MTEWHALAMSCIPRAGPATALDVALVQAAVHDAVQAIEKRYEPYFSSPPATGKESKAAAAAAAAYWVLSDNRVCPNTFQPTLDTAYAPYLAGNDPGLVIGKAAADALLATEYRAATTAAFTPPVGIGQWQPTPPGNLPMTFVYVATLKPFVMDSPSQFRPGPAPALTSERYAKDYNEVLKVGGTLGHPAAGACPAPADTDMARFWGANIPVQWNQVLRDVAVSRQLGIGDTARLLALANLAAADAGIGVWDSKIHYNVWRPITAIHQGNADGNDKTAGDTSWIPFISGAHFPAGSSDAAVPGLRLGRERRDGRVHHDAAAVLQDGQRGVRDLQDFAADGCDLHEPAALSPDLGGGGGSRRCARPARHPLPLRGYRSPDARHARCVAHVHERAAADPQGLVR